MEDSPELQRFLELFYNEYGQFVDLDFGPMEKQKMMMSEMVNKLTNICWDKCITSTPGSKFSSGETTCLTNCAQRYLDMSVLIAKRFDMQ